MKNITLNNQIFEGVSKIIIGNAEFQDVDELISYPNLSVNQYTHPTNWTPEGDGNVWKFMQTYMGLTDLTENGLWIAVIKNNTSTEQYKLNFVLYYGYTDTNNNHQVIVRFARNDYGIISAPQRVSTDSIETYFAYINAGAEITVYQIRMEV